MRGILSLENYIRREYVCLLTFNGHRWDITKVEIGNFLKASEPNFYYNQIILLGIDFINKICYNIKEDIYIESAF